MIFDCAAPGTAMPANGPARRLGKPRQGFVHLSKLTFSPSWDIGEARRDKPRLGDLKERAIMGSLTQSRLGGIAPDNNPATGNDLARRLFWDWFAVGFEWVGWVWCGWEWIWGKFGVGLAWFGPSLCVLGWV